MVVVVVVVVVVLVMVVVVAAARFGNLRGVGCLCALRPISVLRFWISEGWTQTESQY